MIKLCATTVALVPMLIASEVLAQATCTTDTDCRLYETCMPGGTLDCPADGAPSCMAGESDEDCVARRNAWKAENCTETEGAHCKLRWLEPCEDAADCGEGFACDAGQCTAIETACTGDPDCPQYWMCISAASGSSDMDGGGGAPVDMVQLCIPPGSTGTGGTTNQAGSPTDGSPESTRGSENSSDGCTVTASSRGAEMPLVFSALTLVMGLVRWRIRRGAPRKLV
jgi:hypothetical protein